MSGFMPKIDIEIPHPVSAIITIAVALTAIVTVDHFTDFTASVGESSGGQAPQEIVRDAEGEGLRLRQQQAVLQKREEILRYQLQMLREERRLRGPGISSAIETDIDRSEQMLLDLIADQQEAEGKIMLTLKQIWDAQGRAITISRKAGHAELSLAWPVEPTLGISAGFNDVHYEEIFGMPHKAIDIPVDQGTEVLAAADGVVEDVSDNGYGFNAITIRHHGAATLYGHVESFLVEEGDTVRQGQPIALSGGRPGTPGAGHISTGPHVHLEVFVDGERVDPIVYLSKK
ncbi:MAG: peptidase [Candidatus Peregrinibacteria bacterium Greene0416_62]|nr:MAG: peptidase [Candidatus Peregrinibacteria bacterium Greene0416_62]